MPAPLLEPMHAGSFVRALRSCMQEQLFSDRIIATYRVAEQQGCIAEHYKVEFLRPHSMWRTPKRRSHKGLQTIRMAQVPPSSIAWGMQRVQVYYLTAGPINVILVQPAGRQMIFLANNQQVKRY